MLKHWYACIIFLTILLLLVALSFDSVWCAGSAVFVFFVGRFLLWRMERGRIV